MSSLFGKNLARARKFFIGSTLFFSGWTVFNAAAAVELNPLWEFHPLAALAVFGKSCGSGFCWWLTARKIKKQNASPSQAA